MSLPIAEFTRLLQWLSWLLVPVLLHGQAEAGVGGGCSNVVEVLHALQHCTLPAHIWHNHLILLLHNTTEWSCVVVTLGFSTCNQDFIISFLVKFQASLPLLDICLSLSVAAIAFNPEHLLFFWCLLTPELVLKPLPQCWHTKCFISLCTDIMWLLSPLLHLKARLHLSHGNGLTWEKRTN